MFFVPGGMPPGFPGGMPGGFVGMQMDDDDDDDDDDEEWETGGQPGKVDNTRLYKLLELEPSADAADIKKAYRQAAMRHHPDKGGDPEAFKDMQQAFEVLSDPERRKRYDRLGEQGLDKDGPAAGGEDLLSHLFGGGGGNRRGGGPRTKDHVRHLWVTLEQVYTGITRHLPISRKVLAEEEGSTAQECTACGGRGFVVQVVRMGPIVQQVQQPCPSCSGAGSSARTATQREMLEVFVEKGSPDGHKIVFHGKADERHGCEPGDVVVVIRTQDHQQFMRRGADLYVERDVSLADALTGFRLVLQHLDGRKLVIRSRPGEVLRPHSSGVALKAVRGAGMPIHQDPFNFGNLFLALTIRYPASIDPAFSSELRRLLGAPVEPGQDQAAGIAGEEVEEAVAVDMDPLESAKQSKRANGNEAYEEDEHGQHGVQMGCKQQ
mmetsp:Transcript_117882/g.234838  ORF Transcript_117882/g.234838 Transcript_117882/m.234838 type:complete len:435 (-) Transcript_117882:107-1411(-)